MASLNSFKVNSKAIRTGAWIRAGDEFGDLELEVRGFTDAYRNAMSASMRRAAKSFNGDTSKVSAEVTRRIVMDCIDQHVLLDVRNLDDESGKPVTIDAFRGLMRNPDYPDLVEAVSRAATQVGVIVADADEVDAKN